MILNLTPYSAVGPLIFGMSKVETENAIGDINQTTDLLEGIIRIHSPSNDLLAQVSEDDKLIEVGFGRRATSVTLGSINFFTQPKAQVIKELCKLDAGAVYGYGSIVFPALGISLTGFQNEDDDDKAITAFAKGVWDDIIPTLKKFIC